MLESSASKGKLLISEPSILNDLSFNRSVIYLAEHNNDGSIGFILNKPTKFLINDLIPEIPCYFKVYDGGPVERENLYFIHKLPHKIPNSIQIANDIFWGGDFEVLANLLITSNIKPSEIRFFLGYSGWSENQLQFELEESTWVLKDNIFQNILQIDSKDLWKNQLLECGVEYQIWANAPKNPSLN